MRRLLSRILNFPAKMICKREFKMQIFTHFNERPLEYAFVFKCIGLLYPQNVLDVGTGTTALPNLIRSCGTVVTAIDNIKDYWPTGMVNRHYHIIDKDITSNNITLDFDNKFDLITCISVLEHIIDYEKAIQNMFSLLNEGGHLIITCPYTEDNYHENVYLIPESNVFGENIPYVCQSFSGENLKVWLKDNGGKVVIQEFWQCWSGEYWRIGKQIIPPVKVDSRDKHQLTCLLIKKECLS